MPRLKFNLTLEELCWEIVINHLKSLQLQAEYLPPNLIAELFDRITPFIIKSNSNSLPSKLFINLNTIRLPECTWNCLDLPVNDLFKKISNTCKHLRQLQLRQEMNRMPNECFNSIIINNPHLIDLDLSLSSCSDADLSIISKNCPQLRRLNLDQCLLVTDIGVDRLPITITDLNTRNTSVTSTGCLITLKRFSNLKRFEHQWWFNSLELLHEELQSNETREPLRHYQIECMKYIGITKMIKFKDTIMVLFPELKSLGFFRPTMPECITSLITSVNPNVLTCMALHFTTVEFISLVGQLCPMIQDLDISVTFQNRVVDPRLFDEFERNVPFKHLVKFRIKEVYFRPVGFVEMGGWTTGFVKLVSNCHQLEMLHISDFRWITDRMILDILQANPLSNLKHLAIVDYTKLTVELLPVILRSLDSLMVLEIDSCKCSSYSEFEDLKNLVKKMKWGVKLKVRCRLV